MAAWVSGKASWFVRYMYRPNCRSVEASVPNTPARRCIHYLPNWGLEG